MAEARKGNMDQKMLQAQNEYQKMVDSIFGVGAIPITWPQSANHVTGTWLFNKDFIEFKNNYKERLERLHARLTTPQNKKVLSDLVAQIGDMNNWKGNYAELVAYDVLNTDYNREFELNVTRQADFALAQFMGKTNVNYDIFAFNDSYEVYLDVKAFTDTASDIINNGIIAKVLRLDEFRGQDIHIRPCFPLDDNEDYYNSLVKELQDELVFFTREVRDKKIKWEEYQSNIVPRLKYCIYTKDNYHYPYNGEYSPYRKAENMKDDLIKRYCNKFPLEAPFYLVLVNFAWYNQVDINSFGFNRYLYRSLARRTFMQYENDANDKSIHEIINSYNSVETAKFAARKLTGVIFIDDHSIKEKGQDIYIYENPNADNKCPRFSRYLGEVMRKAKDGEYDDFANDNY